jgi:hypothetical protein
VVVHRLAPRSAHRDAVFAPRVVQRRELTEASGARVDVRDGRGRSPATARHGAAAVPADRGRGVGDGPARLVRHTHQADPGVAGGVGNGNEHALGRWMVRCAGC